ncbi:MAG: 16S rRNA (guanine(527)-N(7))-methyltransferase RsmG [Candidatus Binataceae bacterium]
MKPRRPHPEDSAEIGANVRAIVLEYLSRLGYQPLDAEFASRIEQFAAALAIWGTRTNLTARPADAAETAFHIVDSLMPLMLAAGPAGGVLKDAFACDRRVLDLGSGAGFPGLILAAAAPAHFTLMEARRKRASFLTIAAAAMSLRNVTIEGAHCAPSSFKAVFDTITARAFGAPAEVYRSAAAALKAGGMAILYVNPGQQLDLDDARASGLGDCERLEYNVPRGAGGVERILAIWRKC